MKVKNIFICLAVFFAGKLLALFIGDLAMFWAGVLYMELAEK